MAQDNSNSTMEMGTSDQELIAAKRKKKMTFIIGGVAMVVVIALVVTAVVLLSGNEGGSADELVNTTPATPSTVTAAGTTLLPTLAPAVTDPTTPATPEPTTDPGPVPPAPIDLDLITGGAFSPSSFNGTWVSDSEVMYRNYNGDLVLFNAETALETVLLPNSSEVLQAASRGAELSPDRTQVVLAYNVLPVYRHSVLARYAAVPAGGGPAVDVGPEGVTEPLLQNFVWGPSGTAMAFVYLNNVYYKASLAAPAQPISTSGLLHVIYNGIPDWVYEEEVFSSSVAMWFSDSGARIAFGTFNDTEVRVMRVPHYGVPGSVAHQYTSHSEIRYPKPGTTNPTVSVTLVNLATSANTVFEAPTTLSEPILLSVTWVTETGAALAWANRVQNQLEVYLCTEGQPNCVLIFAHSQLNGWVDNNPLIFNSAGTSFVTILPQTVDGALWKQVVQVSQVTAGAVWALQARSNAAHSVAEILRWGDDDVVWYKATHVNDSAEQHLYSLSAAGVLDCFTCSLQHSSGSACQYNDAVLSTDGTRITITCAGPSVPEVYLYNQNGVRERVWEDNSEVTALADAHEMPRTLRYSVPAPDGLPDAQVLLQVPQDVESRNDVPLLVFVYAGPDSAQVTHQWSVDWGSSLVSRWGVAVAHIDGRGSGLRTVDNLFSLNRRLGSVEIEDQIDVTRWLHQNLDWVDSNRTCIWGWSYGGYAASLALVRGGDTFRCAIAVAPVVDWRYYDTIYTERYMDVPTVNAVAYANSSLLNPESVESLRDKRYFLVHGTADDNVHYQHAMLFSRLLQLQDVYFNQMSYTDEDHGLVNVRPHLYHGLEKFLQENML